MADKTENEELARQLRTMNRLGINYDTPGVNPENVAAFAKVLRLVGVVALVGFVCWGLFSDWSYYGSPFEKLAQALGARRSSHREVWAYVMAGGVLVVGWYFRFHVGAILSAAFFWLLSIFGKFFKSV